MLVSKAESMVDGEAVRRGVNDEVPALRIRTSI